MIVGIDLGTTFSVIARLNQEGKAEVIDNKDGTPTLPSVVLFDGNSAIVGEQAKEGMVTDVFDTVAFVKRDMGNKNFSFVSEDKKRYSAEEISALILKRLKEDAEAVTGEKIDGAVITVPAYFADANRKATQDAGTIAGLNVIGMINEPTAAAIAYCHNESVQDEIDLVFDIGGGTFDVTLLKLNNNGKQAEILSTMGDRNLGGYDFDNAIIERVVDEFRNEHGINLEDDEIEYGRLRLNAEKAKIALSTREKTVISVASGGKASRIEITREQFEKMIENYLSTIKDYMNYALEGNPDRKYAWSDVSKIFLVGGSSRIPAIQKLIEDVTGIKPSVALNPDEAVAIGACYYANSIAEKKDEKVPEPSKKVVVKDVCSHSLGIIARDVKNNILYMSSMIKRNTPIPASATKEYSVANDNQTSVKIQIVEGEDEDLEWDTVIATKSLAFDTPKKKGDRIICVMTYDRDGLIRVQVTDKEDNYYLGDVTITRLNNLSSKEIEEKKESISEIIVE